MPESNQIVVTLELNQPKARTEKFLDREFTVVPAVLVRSQVLRNNLGVTYLPAEDITEDWAGIWNGIPVLVGPHPSQRGVPVSGRSPQLWNERCAGWIFNAKAVQETETIRHLGAEVWLDNARASAVEGMAAVLDKLAIGERVELSTGFLINLAETPGVFEGTAYEAVIHPNGADHLVISTEMTGACSVSDGCGLGVNKYEGTMPGDEGTRTGGAAEEKPAANEQSLWSKIKARFSKEREAVENAIEEKIKIDEVFRATHALPVSDNEMQSRIRSALQKKMGATGDVVIADMFTAENLVIFWMFTPFGPQPQGPMYYRASYSVDAEGDDFTFTEPEKVMRVTAYEPYVGTNENPDKPSSSTATNCNCAPTEGATMSDKNKNQEVENAGIDALTKVVTDLATAVQALASDVAGIKKAAEQDPNPAIAGLKKEIGALVGQVASMKGITESAVEERERERQSLVNELAGNYRCAFTAEELEAKPLVELRKLAEMSKGADFSGRGGPRGAQNNGNSGDQRFADTTPYWKKDKTEGGK